MNDWATGYKKYQEGGGGVAMQEGWNVAEVSSVKKKDINGKSAFEVVVKNASGVAKSAFYMTERAQWRIIDFALACGVPEAAFKENSFRPSTDLIGRSVEVKAEPAKDPKFMDFDDYRPCRCGGGESEAPEPTDAIPDYTPADDDDGFAF